ncbi:MAG: hypothetical protein RDV48_23685 [Candidatus Eremiobacteraeota bacterium]|nr:hypothetical protein [Candidatus Eremiobacteraeota bacterium]
MKRSPGGSSFFLPPHQASSAREQRLSLTLRHEKRGGKSGAFTSAREVEF